MYCSKRVLLFFRDVIYRSSVYPELGLRHFALNLFNTWKRSQYRPEKVYTQVRIERRRQSAVLLHEGRDTLALCDLVGHSRHS